MITEYNNSKTVIQMDTTKKPKYSFETLYKGGKEFEENLRMLNEERVREYNLLQQRSPQTEEEFRKQVEESHRLSEERKKRLSEA